MYRLNGITNGSWKSGRKTASERTADLSAGRGERKTEMEIFKNRYQAEKIRKKGEEVIVKVFGGYTIMTYFNYHVWRAQK